MQYHLSILRTYRHFSGRVWLAYDQALREHAAATPGLEINKIIYM